MNGTERLLIDTNIIIYYLAGDPLVTGFLKQRRECLHCSVVTKYDVANMPGGVPRRLQYHRTRS